MAAGGVSYGYIPPHERADKSPVSQNLATNFDADLTNITVRKSFGEDITKRSMMAMLEEDDPNPPHPALVTVLASLNDKMNEQINRLKKMNIESVNTNKSLQFTQDNLKDLKEKVTKLETENENLKKENIEYHRMSRDMVRRIDNIEQRLEQNDHTQRRRNILIEGVAYTAGENVHDIAVDILSKLKTGITHKDFEFVQRVSKPGGKKPILVVFKSVSDRDEILNKKKDLKLKPNLRSIWLNEDANPTIRKQKNECRAVVREAQKQGLDAKQRGTGIVVNNVYYSHGSLNKLPENVTLASTRTKVSETAVGFAGPLAELSNMHRAPYTWKGEGYKTVEQGHFHSKAKYAKDTVAAQAILDTNSPYTARVIGKAIHAPGWEGIELVDLKEHMREKYLQNQRCLKALMDTGTKKLLELTWDLKWAAGYGPYSKQFEKGEQPGQNLTGYTLEELRTEFRGRWETLQASQSTPPPHRAAPAPAAAVDLHSTTVQSAHRGGGANVTQQPHSSRKSSPVPHEAIGENTALNRIIRTSPVTNV